MKTYYYTSQTTHYEPYLVHHGVKGMKWGVAGSLNAVRKQRIVNQYYKEHPNSKLTEKEILEYHKYGVY